MDCGNKQKKPNGDDVFFYVTSEPYRVEAAYPSKLRNRIQLH